MHMTAEIDATSAVLNKVSTDAACRAVNPEENTDVIGQILMADGDHRLFSA